MNVKRLLAAAAASLSLLLILNTGSARAGSRLGATSDDSVCDVGRTDQRTRTSLEPYDFITKQCKNGQVLLGSGAVPMGRAEADIEALAKRYCRMADIQAEHRQSERMGLREDWAQVRCLLSKLPK